MSETDAYEALRPRLQSLGLDPHRVENVLNRGTPDVWYTAGAIEMKALADWPVRPSSNVPIKMRPGQVPWLMRRWANGGPCWIMVRIKRQYLLIPGCYARTVERAVLTRNELMGLVVWATSAQGRGDWEQLRGWLLWDPTQLPPEKRETLLHLIDAARTAIPIAS